MLKIIDFEQFGHVIKLYLGDCDDYWGDDWNDRPYEHNAEAVYDKYVKDTIEIPIQTHLGIVTPEDDYVYLGNSPFSKEDFKNGVPFMVIGEVSGWSFDYHVEVARPQNVVLRYNDPINEVMEKLKPHFLNGWTNTKHFNRKDTR